MLPAVDQEGRLTGRLALIYAAALLPITAALSTTGVTGVTFLVASQIAGMGFVALGWVFLRDRSRQSARRLFLASILYLPVVLGVGVIDMDHQQDAAAQSARPAVASAARTAQQFATAAHDMPQSAEF